VILTRTDQVSPAELEELAQEDRPRGRDDPQAVQVRSLWNKKKHPIAWLHGRSVYAFCGRGEPRGVPPHARVVGATVVKFRAYEDHHPYTAQDLRRMNAEAQEFMAELS
jgi:tetraacyldisaccharide 4'-kinase